MTYHRDVSRAPAGLARCAVAVAVAAALVAPSPAVAEGWRADPGASRIVVHVYKKGIFSAFAHDHHFEATRWRAAVELPAHGSRATSVAVVVAADSLRDRQESLSDEDRRKVDAQAAGPEVLDAQHHPDIEYASHHLELDPGGDDDHVRGTLHGTLTARDRAVPTDAKVEAERSGREWRVHGSARVKQSALGIRPFSGFGGTVGVKDELRIDFTVVLHPAASGEEHPR